MFDIFISFMRYMLVMVIGNHREVYFDSLACVRTKKKTF